MYKRLSVFDGVVSSILSSRADIPRDLYEKLLRKFGEYVLYPRLSSGKAMKRFQEFNCDRMLIDCYAHWRDTIYPVDLRESVIDTNPGWRALDRFCHQKRRLLSSPSRTDMFVLSHIEDTSLYDFYPIIIRTPIKAPQHRLHVHTIQGTKGLFAMGIGNTIQELADDVLQAPLDDPLSANSKSSGEVHRIHLSYFRYLIAKKKFAQHVSDIVEAVSATTAMNDSNMTLLDTPLVLAPKRARRRSSVSEDTLTCPFDPLDLFTIHSLNFFCSFGSGLLVKISNDIVNSFISPSNEYIRSLITTKSVRTAPTDSHSVIRKYVSSNFLQSIRALIADRAHGETAEDACLSFLFRAEVCTNTRLSYRVISSLVYAAVRFIIAETRNDIKSVSFFRKLFSHQVEMKKKLIEWLGILGISPEHGSGCSPITSSPLMLTMVKESRAELDLLYREMSGSCAEPAGWEVELQRRVKACERLAKADLRLLITTANGMGISPIPLEPSSSRINETVFCDEDEIIPTKPSSPDPPSLMQKLVDELRSVREEMGVSKRNSELLYMELSRVKHKLAMDQIDGEIVDDKFIA